MSVSAKQSGFSLIEVMVALVVLSVGMIGMAALHGQSLRASSSAIFRTQAINLTSDMADRIRANRMGQAAYGSAAANTNCTTADCTPAQMAAEDLYQWQQRVQQELPSGQGTVQYNGGTVPPTFTITVQWDESATGTMKHVMAIQVPNS